MMKRKSLYFIEPRKVEVREETLPDIKPGEVMVQSLCSAISPGTEMLIYRGEFPEGAADTHIESLTDLFSYPMCYGYASIGRVTSLGPTVAKEWEGRLVFAFQPHTSNFISKIESLLPLPEGMQPETAAFLPNMETAVNLLQDAAPILGERAMVFGQGIVGLLTAAMLREFPLDKLVTADRYDLRRKTSLGLGVDACLDPGQPGFQDSARSVLDPDADLSLELSGSATALNDAIAVTGFNGRIVVGSWYGTKPVSLNLGGDFHRSRIRLISSQVSSLAPELTGRWDKSRRFETAWSALRRVNPEKWITHRFPLERASDAYRLIDEAPDQTIQVLLTYF
jgi:2-desacetyl-2-hydroxyethyl bacteriochlorophyllide A dehydrogenase